MKKILVFIFLFISLKGFSQYPNGKQTLGSDSNVVEIKGGFHGRVINWRYNDTADANLQRISQYPGAQISVGNTVYVRDSTATTWLYQGSVTDITNIYNYIEDIHINLDSLLNTKMDLQVLTDTSYVEYIGDSLRRECHLYTDGTLVCDTSRIFSETNLYKIIDSTRDTTHAVPHQTIEGQIPFYVTHVPDSDNDSLHLNFYPEGHSGEFLSTDGTNLIWAPASGGGGGNDSAYVDSYLLPDTTGFVLVRDNGGEDTFAFSGGSSLTYPFTTNKYLNGFGAFTTLNTDSITEGSTNKFYTDARARAALSLTTTGTSGAATYNSTTGVFNIPQYAAGISGIGNSGSGYRWVHSSQTSVKTAFAGNGITIDSSSNTNGLTFKADTSILATINDITNISGGGGTPGGSNTQVQFNDGGAFGGDAGMTYVKATDALTVGSITGRWIPRVGSTTSSATPTINSDLYDIYKLTAQTVDITSFTTNLSGTPNDGDILEIQITGTATRLITWGASFVSSSVALPTTTVSTATLTVIFQYFTTSSYGNNKWVCGKTF